MMCVYFQRDIKLRKICLNANVPKWSYSINSDSGKVIAYLGHGKVSLLGILISGLSLSGSTVVSCAYTSTSVVVIFHSRSPGQ